MKRKFFFFIEEKIKTQCNKAFDSQVEAMKEDLYYSPNTLKRYVLCGDEGQSSNPKERYLL